MSNFSIIMGKVIGNSWEKLKKKEKNLLKLKKTFHKLKNKQMMNPTALQKRKE